jgi:hypothetical protein
MGTMRYYFDEMMPRSVANELIKLGIPTLMAVDMDMMESEDEAHLVRAVQEGCVLVTLDRPFAGRTAKSHVEYLGLICWTGRSSDMGGMVSALTHFAQTYTFEQTANQVFWLS